MDFNNFANQIIALKKADSDLRDKLIKDGNLNVGYNSEMESLHNYNAEILDKIIDIIGYPTIDKVGKNASDAAWLVIQHSIGRPAFMKKCMLLLQEAVRLNDAHAIHLAYLTDRIAVFEGRPQCYGTQFDWDIDGVLSPRPIEDIEYVNARRMSIGLNTIEEQIKCIRTQAVIENQQAPSTFDVRKNDFDIWRIRVGWI